MKTNKESICINLKLFDGDAGAAATAPSSETVGAEQTAKSSKAQKNPLANVIYGKQSRSTEPEESVSQAKTSDTVVTSDTQEARQAEFERLIKDEYKDLFDARMQSIINTRFKQTKVLEEEASKAKAVEPMLELLAEKHGIKDKSDIAAIVKAVQEDTSMYEAEAEERGISIDQLKYMKDIERENKRFKEAEAAMQKRDADAQQYAVWMRQAEECKRAFPGFDFKAETLHPETGRRFVDLLSKGIDVSNAYRLIHMDELVGGAMQYAAKQTVEQTVNDIRARGMRPTENGTRTGSAATVVKSDPAKFTRKDRDEISRQVMGGARIEL